jgi:hypothetical protein
MMNSMMMAVSKSMINSRTTSGYTLVPTHAMSLRVNQLSETEYFSAISPKKGSLSTIIRSYKSAVTKKIHTDLNPAFAWQARYYDHNFLKKSDLDNVRSYLALNPENWGKGERSIREEDPINA